MQFDAETLKGAFEILAFGWTGVFVVSFILYAASLGLLKALPKVD